MLRVLKRTVVLQIYGLNRAIQFLVPTTYLDYKKLYYNTESLSFTNSLIQLIQIQSVQKFQFGEIVVNQSINIKTACYQTAFYPMFCCWQSSVCSHLELK